MYALAFIRGPRTNPVTAWFWIGSGVPLLWQDNADCHCGYRVQFVVHADWMVLDYFFRAARVAAGFTARVRALLADYDFTYLCRTWRYRYSVRIPAAVPCQHSGRTCTA